MRRSGQFTTLMPLRYREPITRSAPPRRASIIAGRYFGSCDRSASIWHDEVVVALDRAVKAFEVRHAEAALVRCGAAPCTRPGYFDAELVGDLAGAVGRLIVEHHHRHAGDGHQIRRRGSGCCPSRCRSGSGPASFSCATSAGPRTGASRSAPRSGRPGSRSPRTSAAAPRRSECARDRRNSTRHSRRRRRRRRALTGAKMRSGLKMVMTFSKIRKNFAPSLASRIFERAHTRQRGDRLEGDIVACLDERQRRRRRRRKTVRQQVDELEQVFAPRRPDSRTSGPGSAARSGSSPASSARALPSRRPGVACVRGSRAPITRS